MTTRITKFNTQQIGAKMIKDKLDQLQDRLSNVLACEVSTSATKLLDDSYSIRVALTHQESQSSVVEVCFLKDPQGKTHTLEISVCVIKDTHFNEIQSAINRVEQYTRELVIDKLYDFDTSSTMDAIKKLDALIKELETVACSIEQHPHADSLLADLEIAERYTKKVKDELESSLVDSMRKAGQAYKDTLSKLNNRLTLDDLLGDA